MQLDGIHHITRITADTRGNVDFYARVLRLRLVKKTVNLDAPDVHHLYYGDGRGRVDSEDALGFWVERLAREGVELDPIAWCDRDDEHAAWREHLLNRGARPTPIIDRRYLRERLERSLTPLVNPRAGIART